VDSRILYFGVVSKEEKCDALEACDLLCLPSLSEILPTVYLEAWSCKKPVIAGQAPGLRELVEGNDGGVCVPQEEGEIASAVVRLLRDPELRARMGRNGAALVQRSFSVEQIAIQHEQLYAAVRRLKE
jgi:glycosyltransferase involved in cell wall biosynthesis